ncbi:DNA polymerase III subunit chi [Pseudoalteromonas denitrificans]|uniref:DNA polymerase III, chi subunit n=1 Tax=Pseudoalteromonas denitrificans DSM 6059 TaxID=1123010 RepID=A0A1I1V9A1_9GAMM|nr:DNA polymerase III subunit chi [Pseudoalteromonas denitrificans]SFD77683.1 DNA polymerase III, chi subunit [Pseudoalteromonas denitrificans DSM 6059]
MNAIFYVLKHINEQDEAELDKSIPAHFDLAARLAADQFRLGKRVFIYTNGTTDSHVIDEYLWSFEANSFVPHNLQGEGPANGAPVEIGHSTPVGNRKVLINLATNVPDFINRFNQVFDFVPDDQMLKQAARDRYKYLRQMGVNMTTQDIETKSNS